jgi:hypothetical protein
MGWENCIVTREEAAAEQFREIVKWRFLAKLYAGLWLGTIAVLLGVLVGRG